MTPTTDRRLRKDAAEIEQLLDQLDSAAAAYGAVSMRATERTRYRIPQLHVELLTCGAGGAQRVVVPARNLSRGGTAFLSGHFIYPGTPCVVHLVTTRNQVIPVRGAIARCRYLEGSGSAYEVGVRFANPIDVALFRGGARELRVLLADPCAATQESLPRMLKAVNGVEAQVVCVGDRAAALEAAGTAPFGLLLLDVDGPEVDGLRLVREVRAAGSFRPFVALTARSGSEPRDAAVEAGFDGVLRKPLSAEHVTRLAAALSDEPLPSSHLENAELTEAIDAFVAGIAERVKAFETALAAQKIDDVLRAVQSVRGDADAVGFEAIVAAADAVQRNVAAAADLATVRRSVNSLVRLCLSARPATMR